MEIKLNDVEAYVDVDELTDEVVETQAFDSAVRNLIEDATSSHLTSDDLPETPDMDDYVRRFDLDDAMGVEAIALLNSMPEDPERRCPLGKAFTRAVEMAVVNSDRVQALVECFVADALAAQAQAEEDAVWQASVAALPVPGVVAA